MDDVAYKWAPLCTLEHVDSRACVDDIQENFNPSINCDCPNECSFASYETKTSQLEFPTNRSISKFITSISTQVKNESAMHYVIGAIEKYFDDKLEYTQESLATLRYLIKRSFMYKKSHHNCGNFRFQVNFWKPESIFS